jgi:hypothetical protein
MVRARSSAPIRIVINGRILNEAASPFARLASWEVLRVLAGVPEVDPVLVVPEDASLPGEIERDACRASPGMGQKRFDIGTFREARRQRADLVLARTPGAHLQPAAPRSIYGDGDSLPETTGAAGDWRACARRDARRPGVLRPEDVPVDDYPSMSMFRRSLQPHSTPGHGG